MNLPVHSKLDSSILLSTMTAESDAVRRIAEVEVTTAGEGIEKVLGADDSVSTMLLRGS